MKVIVAGYPKTGTKTMDAALEILGYSVYGHTENLFRLEKEWTNLLNYDGSAKDLRQMYENIDAVTDVPACLFWEEIHEAFPDAKIILTMRKSEDEWVESLHAFVNNMQKNFMITLLKLTSPTQWRLERNLSTPVSRIALGFTPPGPLSRTVTFNKCLAKKRYRAHNAHVLQNAPKDKLLVFNVSEGWEPLCKFLGKPVPDKPFPRKNVRGSIAKEWLATDPLLKRMKREMLFTLAVVTILSGYGAYKLVTKPPTSLFNAAVDWTKSFFSSLKLTN